MRDRLFDRIGALGPQATDRQVQAILNEGDGCLAPRDYLRAGEELRRRVGASADAVLDASIPLGDLRRARHLPAFRATQVSDDAILFQGQAGGLRRLLRPGARRLIVAFAGLGYRLTIAVPMFLQRIDPGAFDVLLLRDPARMQFRTGCAGFGATLPALASAVRRRFPDHAGIVALGTSMGGLAAAGFGILAGASRVIAVGATPPGDAVRAIQGRPVPPAYDLLCDCLPRQPRPILFVAGSGNARDSDYARRCAGLAGGKVRLFDGCSEHVLFYALWKQGRLEAALDEFLHGDWVRG